MKKLLISIFILASLHMQAQTYLYCKPASIVFDKNHKPLKAYQEPIDCYKWMNLHHEGSYQEGVNLYYRSDSTQYSPSNMVHLDDTYNPTGLIDKFLKCDTIYLIMQNRPETSHIADRAYKIAEDGQKYLNNFKLQYIKIPYYSRDKRSYDEIYRQKRLQFKKRK